VDGMHAISRGCSECMRRGLAAWTLLTASPQHCTWLAGWLAGWLGGRLAGSHAKFVPGSRQAENLANRNQPPLPVLATPSLGVLQLVPLQPSVQVHTPGAEQLPLTQPAGHTACEEGRDAMRRAGVSCLQVTQHVLNAAAA
jgi:hypothetical protein